MAIGDKDMEYLEASSRLCLTVSRWVLNPTEINTSPPSISSVSTTRDLTCVAGWDSLVAQQLQGRNGLPGLLSVTDSISVAEEDWRPGYTLTEETWA